jgi:hypothetical protein
MKRLVMAAALASVLFSSSFAGEVPSGGYAPPAPVEPTQTTSETAPGEMPTGGYMEESTDPGLTVIMTILSLLSV